MHTHAHFCKTSPGPLFLQLHSQLPNSQFSTHSLPPSFVVSPLCFQLPPAHLESIGAHVAKANGGGFYASDSTLVPVQLPLNAADGSTAYVIIAGRLSPVADRIERSRAVSTEVLGELTMGQSMANVEGTRFRLVANILVHAMTSASRAKLHMIFGPQPFRTWLAILDNPDLPELVVEPVHVLQMVADATAAEAVRFGAPYGKDGKQLQSRGTKWLASLGEGAQAGTVDAVDPLSSLKQVRLAAQAAVREVSVEARAEAKRVRDAEKAEKRAAREKKVAAAREEKAAREKAAREKAAAEQATAEKATADKATRGKAASDKAAREKTDKAAREKAAAGKPAATTPAATTAAPAAAPAAGTPAVGTPAVGTSAAHTPADIAVGAMCWYTPANSSDGKGRRRVEITGTKHTPSGEVRYIFDQQVKGQLKPRAVPHDQLSLISSVHSGAAEEAMREAERKAQHKAAQKAQRKAERKAARKAARRDERVREEAAAEREVAEREAAEREAERKAARKRARKAQRDAECGGDKGGAERNRERKVPRGLDSSVEQQSIRNQIRVLRMQISANTDNATRVEQIGAKIRLELELEQLMERV